MDLINYKRTEIGIETYFIPYECTSIGQWIVIGVGKPFKGHLMPNWIDWVVEFGKDIINCPQPCCKQVVKWIDTSLATMSRRAFETVG